MASMNIFRDMLRKDTDNDGVPDWRDRDDDNDGVLDKYDRTPKGRSFMTKRRVGSQKIVKSRDGKKTSVLSFAGPMLLQRKTNSAAPASNMATPAVVSPTGGLRSTLSTQRGYARGPLTLRGQGRDTGVTKVDTRSARADLVKMAAPTRFSEHGRTRRPGERI